MGVKKTGDLLEKLTWGFVIALIVLSLSVTLVMKPAESEVEETEPAATEQPAAEPAAK
jgi:preprotein translocase subunit SecG